MAQHGLHVGEGSRPRFEFRSFGQDFSRAHYRMGRLSAPVPEDVWERRSDEIYIVSRADDAHNAKIRNATIEIKTLVQCVEGLEQWKPSMKGTFPMTTERLATEVFPAFQVTTPTPPDEEWTRDAFLEMACAHPDLQMVRVHKQRFGYLVHGAICEYAVVLVNGARVVTVGVESTEIPDIERAVADIGLGGVENINYLQAIKRVIGMSRRPLAHG